MTKAQADFIRSLASRILDVNVEALPTKAKAAYPARFTFNPQANAAASQATARAVLAQLDAGEIVLSGHASNCINDLKVAARRAGL